MGVGGLEVLGVKCVACLIVLVSSGVNEKPRL